MLRRIMSGWKTRTQKQRRRIRRCALEWMEPRTLLAADLSITKTAHTDLVLAGEELFYEIRILNSGPDPAADVTVTDTLPAGLSFLGDNAATTPAGGCTLAAGVVTCLFGTLPNGASRTFQLKMQVAADFVAAESDGTKTLSNTISVSTTTADNNLANNSDTALTFVEDEADLRVIKVSKPDDEVRTGEDFTYTIYVENLGPSYARGVRLSDLTIANENFQIVSVTDDPNRTDSCTIVPGFGAATQSSSITCTLLAPLEPLGNNVSPPPVPNTGIWTIQIVARSAPVDAPTDPSHSSLAYDVNNSVRVFTQFPGPGAGTSTPDPDTSNNLATDSIRVIPVTDLQVFSVFGAEVQTNGLPGSTINTNALPPMPDPTCCNFGGTTVTAGRRFEWTSSVLVAGPSNAENVRIEVLLPFGASIIENTLTGLPNPGQVPGRCTTSPAGALRSTVICEYGNLNSGQQATVKFQALVDPSLPVGTQLSVDSRAFTDTIDTDHSNNSTSIQFDTNAFADLRIAKTDDPDPVFAGGLLTYTLVSTNDGPSAAQNVQIVDTTPTGTTFSSLVVSPGGSCVTPVVGAAGTITCTWDGGTAPNASRTLTLRLAVDPSLAAGTILNNTASTSSSTPDPVLADNTTGVITTTVAAAADLSIDKNSVQQKVTSGTQTRFTIFVENLGPSDAVDVVVVDVLPVGVTYETDTDACVQAPLGTLTCSLGTLGPGESTAFDIWVFVNANVSPNTTLINTATVSSATPDPDLSNNTDTASILVLREDTDLQITKTAPDTAELGSEITYTITVTNAGLVPATDVVVKDFLPVGLNPQAYLPQTGNCLAGVVGDALRPTTCNLGTLAPGASVDIDVVAIVANNLQDLTQLFNDASVSSASAESSPSDNVVHSTTTALQTANGNVSAVVRSGQLFINGDKFNNKIRIEAATPADPNAYRIVPLGGTKVNGQFDSVQVHAARGITTMTMSDGNDTVLMPGNPITFTKKLTINLGRGYDVLVMTDVTARGATSINADGGNDSVEILDSFFAGKLDIKMGTGDDDVTLIAVDVAGSLLIGADGGDDDIEIFDSGIGGTLTIKTGLGNDTVLIQGSSIAKAATVGNDGNDDEVTVLDSVFASSTTFLGGSGVDTLDALNPANNNSFAKPPTIKKYEVIL